MGEHGEQRRVGLSQHELQRAGIGRPYFLDDPRHAAQQRAPDDHARRRPSAIGIPPPLEAGRRLLRRERRAVVEARAVTKREGPHEAIARDGPSGSQGRLDVGRRLTIGHERVEDLAEDQRARSFERRHRIERGRHPGDADPHLAARRHGCGHGGKRR